VICEFMDEDAIRDGFGGFDVLYDAKLVDQPEALNPGRAGRPRAGGPQPHAGAAARCSRRRGSCRSSVGSASASTTSTSTPARARNIAVYPATGANDVSVAEYVIATAMLLLRGAYGATPEVIAGTWPRNRLMGREISGSASGSTASGDRQGDQRVAPRRSA
jgi:(S)-sulfolactate dehydrogenase